MEETRDKTSDSAIKAALQFDPLHNAELITDRSYKDDPLTMTLGLIAMMQNNATRARMLQEQNDSTFSNELPRYREIIAAEGFVEALSIPFHSKSSEREEKFFIFFQERDGILLAFDTWDGMTCVSGGNFYYNWRQGNSDECCDVTSSGCWNNPNKTEHFDSSWIWAGRHDCREAIRFHIRQLREHGSFVTPWQFDPRPWLIHHGDKLPEVSFSTLNIYDQKRKERIAMLPESVRRCVQVGEVQQ